MKLYYTKSSPFARKVLINSIEAGVFESLNLINLSKSGTFQLPKNFDNINPLFKIPALEIKNDDIIIDSPVICEYLDFISVQRKLLPTDITEKFFQLKLQALADGLMEAAVLRRYESLREPHQQSHEFDSKQLQKINATLNYFNNHVGFLKTPYMIGEVAIMCAIGYMDYRFPHETWRSKNPNLEKWFKLAQQWLPFQSTQPG